MARWPARGTAERSAGLAPCKNRGRDARCHHTRRGHRRSQEHPDPAAAARRAARPRARRGAQRRRHPCSCAGRYPAPPGCAAGHPRPRAGRRGRGDRARRRALRARRPRHGHRRRRRPGGARACVHERVAMPVPDELDWTAAGGVPEVFTTAHDALFTQGGLVVGRAAARPRRGRRRRHGRRPAGHDGGRSGHRDRPQRARARADRRARRQRDRAPRASPSRARST